VSENGHPRLKRHYSVIAHSPDDVELRYGVWNPVSYTVADESRAGRLHRLIGRLDGSASPAEIASQEDVPREDVEGLVDHLDGLGVIEFGPTSALDHYLETVVPWRVQRQDPPPVVLLGDAQLTRPIEANLASALPAGRVTFAGEDDPGWRAVADPDTSWLRDGLALEERLEAVEHWRGSFLICASAVINPMRLLALNRLCVEAGIPWLHAAADGPFLLIGPVILPRRSSCYECLEIRVLMNLRESASYQRYKQALAARQVTEGDLPIEPVLASMLGAHTALEAMNFLLTESSFTLGKLLAVYLPTMEFTFNEVLRAPTCSACGPVSERDETGLYFDLAGFLRG
jgi:bacteriocin biosynthesis cyclodehydratase domain-containing protein